MDGASLTQAPLLEVVIELLGRDPLLGYSLLAALFLAAVSVGSGIIRLDFLALARSSTVIQLSVAVLLAFGLSLLVQRLATGGLGMSDSVAGAALTDMVAADMVAGASAASANPIPWSLAGIERFPLYLVALAYGPTLGLLAGVLFSAFHSAPLPTAGDLVLLLELVLIGWLAIYPSPRQFRWAGPFDALLGYSLAWLTGGLAWQRYSTGEVRLDALLAPHQAHAVGLLVTLLLLFLLHPGRYARFFPGSRIAPPGAAAYAGGTIDAIVLEAPERYLLLDALEPNQHRPNQHRSHAEFLPPGLPSERQRRRRTRRLEPPPPFDDG